VIEVSPLDAATLPDLSEEAPAGENLELDAEFGALERAAQGRPETQYGDTINPATPPDWKETEAIALALLERTRDLRIMTHLAVARLHLAGIPGFAEVLGQIRYQLEDRWQQVHPQLDPEDDNDPTLRANALYRLQDPANVLRPLRDLPLATSTMTGPISWRDIAVFNGVAEPEPGRDRPTEALIRGAFQKTNRERLDELRNAVDQAVREVAAILAAFEAQAGAGTGPNFTSLEKLLSDIQKELQRFAIVPEDEPDSEPEPEEASETAETTRPTPRAVVSRGSVSVRDITVVHSRDDALYLLELASAYFRTSEPSSPLPMLIDRARRLASMEFLDILRDLAPDGLGQAQLIAGSPPE
jgi:type VI secretion system protein ImpA